MIKWCYRKYPRSGWPDVSAIGGRLERHTHFSIANIDVKVASIDDELKELQELKKQLKSAKSIALTIGAEVFAEYGVDKLEGAGISSITTTKSSTKKKLKLNVLNEDELIKAGYHRVVLDEQAVIDGFNDDYELEFLQEHCSLEVERVVTPAKLKINRRRNTTVKLSQEVA